MTVVDASSGLSVDRLAAEAGISVRTVRYYQSEGLLPAPARQGREARYGVEHVDRLRLIHQLRDRGLKLSTIAELLERVPDVVPDESAMSEWLGLHEQLHRPWTDDSPVLLNEAELAERLAGTPSGTAESLTRTGLIERRADTTPVVYFVPSPALLDVALDTIRVGLDLDTAVMLYELLQRRLRKTATELVARFTEEVSVRQLAGEGPGALARLMARLQPLTRRSVDLIFAHEMEQAQRQLVALTEENSQ